MGGDDGFFDAVYAGAEGDDTAIPWQEHAASRPLFDDWYQGLGESQGAPALVVAAGLGDDAAALAEKGYAVTAFDAAPTAVEWARRRHPDAPVEWHVADLFDAPAAWSGAFALVVEIFTVQSIPLDLEVDAARAIRGFVAPGGTLLAIALLGDPTGRDRPWPLAPHVVDALIGDLTEKGRHGRPLGPGVEAVRFELQRPSS